MAVKTSGIAVFAACLWVSSAFAQTDDTTIQGHCFLHRQGGCRAHQLRERSEAVVCPDGRRAPFLV